MPDLLECPKCGRQYKTKSGLAKHEKSGKACHLSKSNAKRKLSAAHQPPEFARDGWAPQTDVSPTILTRKVDGSAGTTTVGDRILEDLVATLDVTAVAARHGISRGTLLGWLRDGSRAVTHEEIHGPDSLSNQQALLADFSRAVDAQMARAQIHEDTLHAQMARGGRKRRRSRTVEKRVGDDVEVTTTIEEEELHPDVAALQWRLERRSSRYLKPTVVEVSGAGGGPVELEHRVGALAASFRDRFGLPPAGPSDG